MLPCWLSEIKNGNNEIEHILIERLSERLNEIRKGHLVFLSTLRINDDVFSTLSSKKMLNVAFEYASLDTCIYYKGEGPSHFGYIGLLHLIKIVDKTYNDKFQGRFLDLIIEDKVLARYDEESCEYQSHLYDKLYSMVKYDYENGLIGLRSITNGSEKN